MPVVPEVVEGHVPPHGVVADGADDGGEVVLSQEGVVRCHARFEQTEEESGFLGN